MYYYVPKVKNNAEPILIWKFHEAPEEYQKLSRHGGGEDWIAFVPSHYDRYYIGWLESGGAFGTCDVSSHPAKKGTVFIGAHA